MSSQVVGDTVAMRPIKARLAMQDVIRERIEALAAIQSLDPTMRGTRLLLSHAQVQSRFGFATLHVLSTDSLDGEAAVPVQYKDHGPVFSFQEYAQAACEADANSRNYRTASIAFEAIATFERRSPRGPQPPR